MKTLKVVLLTVVLLLVGMLAGCQEGYAQRSGKELTKVRIYHERADGLNIPSYSYRP